MNTSDKVPHTWRKLSLFFVFPLHLAIMCPIMTAGHCLCPQPSFLKAESIWHLERLSSTWKTIYPPRSHQWEDTLFSKSDLVSNQPNLHAWVFNILLSEAGCNHMNVDGLLNSSFLLLPQPVITNAISLPLPSFPLPDCPQNTTHAYTLHLHMHTHTSIHQFQERIGGNNPATKIYGNRFAFTSTCLHHPLSSS